MQVRRSRSSACRALSPRSATCPRSTHTSRARSHPVRSRPMRQKGAAQARTRAPCGPRRSAGSLIGRARSRSHRGTPSGRPTRPCLLGADFRAPSPRSRTRARAAGARLEVQAPPRPGCNLRVRGLPRSLAPLRPRLETNLRCRRVRYRASCPVDLDLFPPPPPPRCRTIAPQPHPPLRHTLHHTPKHRRPACRPRCTARRHTASRFRCAACHRCHTAAHRWH
mmetsp:Transcript_41354/g.97224  ORF Transcript_41354/g.97224 Transcript_41354/m.97224 type:complete len:223 (-) Transcript_41354:732-1400(-)